MNRPEEVFWGSPWMVKAKRTLKFERDRVNYVQRCNVPAKRNRVWVPDPNRDARERWR